jgi:formamidopyrimidine-DNA glycosylase
MPELPEVETVARQLAPLVTGRTVRRLEVLDPLLKPRRLPAVRGRAITAVTRSGKQVVFAFSGAPLFLAVHLRMTGRLIFRESDAEVAALRARFVLDRGELQFVDTRRFGTFTWSARQETFEPVGVDPLTSRFDVNVLSRLLAHSPTPLKVWLLRQDKLVGIGNIYASEICWEAKLSPFRAAGRLRVAERERLCVAIRLVLERAIANSGTTFSDFQDAHGLTGSYQRLLGVYEREGEPCARCGTAIQRVTQAQRSTYWCSGCLK